MPVPGTERAGFHAPAPVTRGRSGRALPRSASRGTAGRRPGRSARARTGQPSRDWPGPVKSTSPPAGAVRITGRILCQRPAVGSRSREMRRRYDMTGWIPRSSITDAAKFARLVRMKIIMATRTIDRRPECLLQSALVRWQWATDTGGMSHASGTGTGRGLGTGQGLSGVDTSAGDDMRNSPGATGPGDVKVRAPTDALK